MKILVVCGGDRSDHHVALNCIKYLIKEKKDSFIFCVVDNNKKIINFLKRKKLNYKLKRDVGLYFEKIKKNEFSWLLNIWGTLVFKKIFLKKFKKNLNIHPSYLPYARGRDPYVWSIQKNLPVGTTIHQMDENVDSGKYYVQKKLNIKNFPTKAGEIFNLSLYESKKLFMENWKKIRTNKIKAKKFKKLKKKFLKEKI